MDKQLLFDSSDKIVSHSKDLFAYLNEPNEKSADILVKRFLEKNYLDENDIDAVAVNLLARKWVRKIKRAKSIMNKANNQFNLLIDRYSQVDKERIKVTSKNISPKAKKYGIIEPTNKVGDLDAVESICRR